jgi:hypothetical protein
MLLRWLRRKRMRGKEEMRNPKGIRNLGVDGRIICNG